SPKKELHWMTNYTEALAVAQKESKPLFLYFTGSDWCGWCFKMDSEILASDDFIDIVGNKFVFVSVDFPVYKELTPALTKQNEELKEQYKIHGFPTIIILDQAGKEFATLNYRQGGGKSYGEYLLKVLDDHTQFQQGIKSPEKQTTASLQKLYTRANHLGMTATAQKLLEVGLTRNDTTFFLKEQYRNLLNQDKIGSVEAESIREKLLAMDPNNKERLHYDVAILDFEAHARKLPQADSADTAIKPLQNYLARFGNKDTKERWRIEMTISQVLRSKNQVREALGYAKDSHKNAPVYLRSDINTSIAELEEEVKAIANAE
ncbi:MAG: putative disulfide bond isomerase, partial [Chlamydiia bacterium]|nr:putative disulfide bond isomerase [Chlamydiia bacterium]